MEKFLKSVFFDIETYRLSIIFTIVFSALLVIDYKDIIANYLVSGDLAIAIIIGICIAFVALLFLLRHHFFDMIVKIPTVNGLDRATVLCCVFTALYFVSIHLINQVYNYKCLILIVYFFLCLSFFTFRIIRYCFLINKSEIDDKAMLILYQNKVKKLKIIPLNKQSKKAQHAYYAEQRGDWNGVKPVTKIVESKKVYNRKKSKSFEI